MWFPVFSVTAPVVSPSPASAFLVVPSTWRPKRPGSSDGDRLLRTSSVPVIRTFVKVHSTSSPELSRNVAVLPLPDEVGAASVPSHEIPLRAQSGSADSVTLYGVSLGSTEIVLAP